MTLYPSFAGAVPFGQERCQSNFIPTILPSSGRERRLSHRIEAVLKRLLIYRNRQCHRDFGMRTVLSFREIVDDLANSPGLLFAFSATVVEAEML